MYSYLLSLKDQFEQVSMDRCTLGTFVREHKTERYIIIVSGHALAVCDGKIFDHSYKPGRRVQQAFRYKGNIDALVAK